MKLSILLVINAIVILIFGIALIVVPAATMSLYGITSEPALNFTAQLFGATLITIGILTGMTARNTTASDVLQAIVLALLIGNAISFIVALIGQLSGVMNGVGWVIVAIYLLLALGYAYFQFLQSSAIRPAPST